MYKIAIGTLRSYCYSNLTSYFIHELVVTFVLDEHPHPAPLCEPGCYRGCCCVFIGSLSILYLMDRKWNTFTPTSPQWLMAPVDLIRHKLFHNFPLYMWINMYNQPGLVPGFYLLP